MRRLWLTVGIIAPLAALCGLPLLHLDRLTGELIQHIEEADECLYRDDWEGARAVLQETYDLWESHALYLHTTLHHEDIDAVRASLRESMAYTDIRQDKAECLAVNARLVNLLELLLEAELPTIKNLM